MNPKYKKHVQEPYQEAWSILKTIREDNSDEAWRNFIKQLDTFYERIKTVPSKGNKDYIKGEKEYIESLYTVMLQVGEMSAWILSHGNE